MKESRGDLPEFDDPPLVEVALSVSFEPIEALKTSHLGLLWANEFKSQFPQTDDHPPLESRIEAFGAEDASRLRYRVELSRTAPLNRVWFLDDPGNELIQIQRDRFVHNWRKVGDESSYPRYETIREKFLEELEKFESFVSAESLGDMGYLQCEITYVDHIEPGDSWSHHGELDGVWTVFQRKYSDDFLRDPEGVQMNLRYAIPGPDDKQVGRLHMTVDSVYSTQDQAPLFVMRCTARGRPQQPSREGVAGFLDLGREWCVRGFASITTGEMHSAWKRKGVKDGG